jgi:CRISPR/Cas system-associated protein Csm6
LPRRAILVLAVVKQSVGAAISSFAVAQNREGAAVVIHVATHASRVAARLLRRSLQSLKRECHRTLTVVRQ